jgi:hypothetical protein
LSCPLSTKRLGRHDARWRLEARNPRVSAIDAHGSVSPDAPVILVAGILNADVKKGGVGAKQGVLTAE